MTTDLQPYSEYKDSGLSWLDSVPKHWDIGRNGRLFSQRNETGFGSLPILEVSLRTGVRVRDMENLKRKQVMSDREKYKRAAKNDIAYNMMRMWQGAVGVAPEDGLVSPAYVVAQPYPEAEPRYFSYLFKTDAYKNEIDGYSRGIVKDRNRLYWEDFKRMSSCAPPREEQKTIADYLDANAVKVNRLIRNRRRLIEVLNEQKQAIINRAVTRGLDPNVPLKPSGIDWLGDIPEHWEVRKLGNLGSFSKGRGISRADITDAGVPAITYGDIYTTYNVEAKQLEKYTSALVATNAQEILKGDLLFTASGETIEDIGKTTLYSGDVPGYAGGDIIILRPTEGDGLYLSYVLNSSLGVQQKSLFGRGDIIVHIAASKLKQIIVPFPSKEEQTSIARFLDNDLKCLHDAIDRAQREIDLIRDYRTRLISDVVTGKVDVRGFAPISGDIPEDLDEGIDDAMLEDDEPELVEEVANE